jgi:protein TonB
MSIGLHAAAAVAYGGYRLGAEDRPPQFSMEGSQWVSISIRGAPGAAGRRAAGESAVGESVPGGIAGEPVAQPVLEGEPAPALEPLAAPPAAPPPSVLPLVAAAAPAIEELAVAIGHSLEDALELSIESVTHPPESGAVQNPAAEPQSESESAIVAMGGGEGVASGGDDVSGGVGLGDAGPGDGANRGDGPGGGEAGAGVRGLGVDGGNQPPVYPQEARLAGQEGVVIVLALSDASGAVEQVSIEESSGFPLLDDSALEAVRRWRFVPALENGVAVAGYVRVPIRFVLRR